MNIALWIVAGVTAAAFIGAGTFKLTQGSKVEEKGMAWAKHFSDAGVRGIGAAELLGGLGLILPALTGIATWLVPVAAAGLVITMIGAVITHVRDRDPAQALAAPSVLGILAAFVMVGRFWIEPFGG